MKSQMRREAIFTHLTSPRIEHMLLSLLCYAIFTCLCFQILHMTSFHNKILANCYFLYYHNVYNIIMFMLHWMFNMDHFHNYSTYILPEVCNFIWMHIFLLYFAKPWFANIAVIWGEKRKKSDNNAQLQAKTSQQDFIPWIQHSPLNKQIFCPIPLY